MYFIPRLVFSSFYIFILAYCVRLLPKVCVICLSFVRNHFSYYSTTSGQVYHAVSIDQKPLRKQYLEAILPPFVAVLRRWRPILAGIHELATADGLNPLTVDDRALAADALPVEVTQCAFVCAHTHRKRCMCIHYTYTFVYVDYNADAMVCICMCCSHSCHF